MQAPVTTQLYTGTACGTLLALSVSIYPADLVRTAEVAAVGALVSFCMSLFLKWLKDKFR